MNKSLRFARNVCWHIISANAITLLIVSLVALLIPVLYFPDSKLAKITGVILISFGLLSIVIVLGIPLVGVIRRAIHWLRDEWRDA